MIYNPVSTNPLRTRQDMENAAVQLLTPLLDKLSDALTEEQKVKKIDNLLTKLRRAGRIHNAGSRGQPAWALAE